MPSCPHSLHPGRLPAATEIQEIPRRLNGETRVFRTFSDAPRDFPEFPKAQRAAGSQTAFVIPAVVSNAIDTTALLPYSDPGVEGVAAFWKFATRGLANGLVGIGIAAAIGATALSGVEWRLAKNAGAHAAERVLAERKPPETS